MDVVARQRNFVKIKFVFDFWKIELNFLGLFEGMLNNLLDISFNIFSLVQYDILGSVLNHCLHLISWYFCLILLIKFTILDNKVVDF